MKDIMKFDGYFNEKNLSKILMLVSVIIGIVLLPFVLVMFSFFPGIYFGDGSSYSTVTMDVANKIAIFIWPVLIVYIIFLIYVISKKTENRKMYYPVAFVTICYIIFILVLVYQGIFAMWYTIIFSFPIAAIATTLWFIGDMLERNLMKKITAISILFGVTLIVIFILVLRFTEFGNNLKYSTIDDVKYEIEEIADGEINVYFYNASGNYYSVGKEYYDLDNNVYYYLKKRGKEKIVGANIDIEGNSKFYVTDYKEKKKLVYEQIEVNDDNKKSSQEILIKKFNDVLIKYNASVYELKLLDEKKLESFELLFDDTKISQDENEFCNYLIDMFLEIEPLLKKYSYSKNIYFNFVNKNPFAKDESSFYQKKGYIKYSNIIGSNKNWYQIYLNSIPVEIAK